MKMVVDTGEVPPFAKTESEQMGLRGLKSLVNRMDRGVGAVLWPLVTIFFGGAAFVSALGVYVAITQVSGPERWALLALALACSVLFGAGARKASRRRRASEWLDEI